MSLITKRLSTLTAGTQIQVSHGQDLRFLQATVTDNDFSSCLEVRDSDGGIHYLDYSTVKSLALLGAVPLSAAAKKELLHEKSVQNVSLGISDRELKLLFDALDKTEKQLLQKGCDSFFYGVRIGSNAKMLEAGELTRRTIFQKESAGAHWSAAAFRLAGSMLVRCGIYDPALFVRAGLWVEAAYCHNRNNRFTGGALPAAMALLDRSLSADRKQDMTVILAKSCLESGDASVVPILARKGIDCTELTRQLLLAREITPPADAAPELLLEHYPVTEAGELMEQALAPLQPKLLTGTITKLLWINSTGTILFQEDGAPRSIPFRYSDIVGEDLKQKVSLAGSDPAKVGGMVRFRLKDGRAVELEFAPKPMTLAREALREERFADALDYLRMEAEQSSSGDVLFTIAQAALDSKDVTLIRESLDFCTEHQDIYPRGSKATSLLGRMYQQLGQWQEAVDLTDQALNAEHNIPPKLHSGLLCQFMSFCFRAWDATGEEGYLRRIYPKADKWLEIFREHLSDDINLCHKLSKVLQWKLRSHCANGQLAEAEAAYAELARRFPTDSQLAVCADCVASLRQTLSEAAETPAAPAPVIPDPEPGDSAEEPDFQDPGYTDPEEEPVNTLVHVTHALNMDRFESMLTYLKAVSMNDSQIRMLHDAISHAVNSPMTANRYDTQSVVALMDGGEGLCPELKQLCTASSYLRCLFQDPQAPTWLRQSIPLFQQIPILDSVHLKLTAFTHAAGQDPDRYAAYHDEAQNEWESLQKRAQYLYTMYMENPPRDSAKFARLLKTKQLVFLSLRDALGHAAAGRKEELEKLRPAFCKQFNGEGLQVSQEKADAFIAANWASAGRLMPLARESATLQGSRRSGLRSALNAILAAVNDCFRYLDEHRALSTTDQGRECFQSLAPAMIGELTLLEHYCQDKAAQAPSREAQVGFNILGRTAGELRDKLTGSWNPGSEKLLFAQFLLSGQVPLDEQLLPDLHGTFRGWGDLDLKARIEAHDHASLLSPQDRMDRIFSRDRRCQDFGTARRMAQYAPQLGWSVAVPQNAERYVNQAKLMAQLDLEELREIIAQARTRGGDAETLDHLEQMLLHFYVHCGEELQFGFLTQITDAIRSKLDEMKGADTL